MFCCCITLGYPIQILTRVVLFSLKENCKDRCHHTQNIMLAFARICVRVFAYGHTLHADPRGWGSKGAGTNAALVCRDKNGM